MWSEERIRDALEKKQERLKDTEHQIDILQRMLEGYDFFGDPTGGAAMAVELGEQRKRAEKIKNQIEVLKYILDI